MNKNCYRIIFSKAKNMFIAVAENIKSQTKTAGQSADLNRAEKSDHTPFHQTWQVKGLVASMSLFMSLAPVYAQIQVAPNAQASQKASIGVGRNQQGQNVPVVNIQTPKNGVSHNVYNQFDVLQPGVVLNNSRNGASSVIVGNVGANPYLQIGEARVILNEVNSSAASQFKGNLEVAGQRADVIIANPSGINIQGGGFINANKAIFTTGKIQLNPDGSIQQFVVDQGKVNVSSTGNNLGLGGINNNADYVDIYAKAVELNAQVHANQTLQVITGSNTVSNDLSTITPNQVNSTTPTFALDVKALGGMYANNIFIIGTDKGLGVRNAGTIQSPQTLVITSAGKIENTGTLKNTSPQGSLLSISTGEGADIVSSGSMISNGNLLLESGRNITFDRARLEKNGVDNPNIISVSAKGDVNFKNSSNVQNFGEGGNLYIDAKNINLDSNMNIGVNGSIQLVADNNIRIQDSGNFSSVNDIYIQAKNDLNIENSKISANQGDIN
ncbi:two-partner secretion domain-containing protein, partial [Acinetobacter guillouiae]|uniref:two-partner secretion domain-containing protein n=1 Tax=Acinetobacter guillouiae TaxID=106649 RepID=UPI00125F26D4